MNRLLLVPLTALSLLLAPAVTGTAAAGSAAVDPRVPVDSGSLLPFSGSSSGDVVVDEANSHVFVSGGPGTTGVVVADLDGAVQQTIPDLGGAEGMLLSDDGRTLYVALADDGAVAAIDTSTLDVATTPAGDGSCPRHLAQVGTDIYLTQSCDDVQFGVQRLATRTGAVADVTLAGEPDQLLENAGPIVADKAKPNRFYVADNAAGAQLVRAYDVTGLTATSAATFDAGGTVRGLAFSPNGQQLAVAFDGAGDRLAALDPDRLRQRFTFTAGGPYAASVATDYVASSTGERVRVHDRTGTHVRSYPFAGDVSLGTDSVEWGGDRLFAVAEDADGARRLYTFADFATPSPLILLSGPESTTIGTTAPLVGTATLSGLPFAERELTVVRSGADGDVPLPPVTTAADGTFTIEDAPAARGDYRYTVTSAPETGVAADTESFAQHVNGLTTQVDLTEPPVFSPGEPVLVEGTVLTSDGEPVGGATVTVTHTYDGQTTTLGGPFVTDAEGKFSIEVTDAAPGRHTFEATFDGDPTHEPSSARRAAFVKHDVALSASGPSTFALMSRDAAITGTLTLADGTPLAGADVSWARTTADPADSGSARTGADGSFTFTDAPAESGQVRWLVSYVGDDAHKAAEAEVVVPVYEQRPALSVATDRTRYRYGTEATVTVSMPDDAEGTLKVYTEPNGQQPQLVVEQNLADGASAVLTVPATRNTQVTAVYEPAQGVYTYAPRQVSRSVVVVPVMAQELRGHHGMDGRAHLVRTSVNPRFAVKVTPSLAGDCVHVRAERYRDGAWRLVKRSACITLNEWSRATWTLAADRSAGSRFRLRYEWPGTSEYTEAKASWVYLRFTR